MKLRTYLYLPVFFTVFLPACVSLDPSAVFSEPQVVQAYVDWLEAERRRDLDLARNRLYFQSRADEDRLEEEFAALAEVPAGAIRTEAEIRLVGHPADWGPGEYMFLTPKMGRYIPVTARIVGRKGKVLILYEPPILSVQERKKLRPEVQARMVIKARIDYLKDLDKDQLLEEVKKVRQRLKHQIAAKAYAEQNKLPLAPFDPSPETILIELSGLDDETARNWMLAQLKSALTR